MKALAKVIGFAPSEIPFSQLEERIAKEHHRVVDGLTKGAYAYGENKKKKVTKRVAAKSTIAKRLEKKHGMSLSEMEAKLEKLRKYEEAQEEAKGE